LRDRRHRGNPGAFRVHCGVGLIAAVLLTGGIKVRAQAPLEPVVSVPVRSYHILRYEDDWSFLRDPALRTDWLDCLKYLPLRKGNGGSYLSLGGEFRQSAENVHHDAWKKAPPSAQTFALERLQLHADAHLNQRLRIFLQLESGLEEGREGGPRVIDLKRLDFLNAFAELRLSHAAEPAFLRVGRQEIQLGSGRLVAVREGPNVRQSFYGVRLNAPLRGWQTSWFALRPAADKPGFFDNVPLQTTTFAGAFATRSWRPGSRNLLDIYFYSLDRKHATYNRGSGRELRETLGARVASRDPASTAGRVFIPHFDVEGAWQFGEFAQARIQAWTLAAEVGSNFSALPFSPRLGLRANVTSGDRNATTGSLGTFHPLFPIGNYFGILVDTGPGPLNSRDLHPNLRLFLPHGIAVNTDWLMWWRQSLNDGVYSVPGNLLIAAGKSQARFVGHRPGMEVRWQIDRHTYLQGDYGVFFAGPFLRESGRTGNLNFASIWLGYKF